ncbi:hypothetical protein [Streptomyces arenae]|uniref:hypothetical protein n=1 Tax=Streptomyces arenae TaxID=29301 RepID=UPI00265945C2|nr:hypothetical protein [Streptomyces arenae]MCG7209546.1 hypothetical protein [Streptomyces arenae]
MHRLLPPSAIAGVSLVCALGPWLFSDRTVLRTLAAIAAATAAVGAAVMRRWDSEAGKQVADLSRARASDEWRHEERIAELETDLEESRELRTKLEQRLRAKRTELAGLRNEHASLLRRYATAETERASALEGRRLLEIEAAEPTNALPAARSGDDPAEPTDEAPTDGALTDGASAAEDAAEGTASEENAPEGTAPEVPAVFSPAGSKLFLRAKVALARFDEGDAPAVAAAADADTEAAPEQATEHAAPKAAAAPEAPEDEAQGKPEAADGHTRAAADTPAAPEPTAPAAEAEEDVRGTEEDVRGAEEDVHVSTAPSANSVQPSGHFTVPTAVAVLPAAPIPRPLVTGGFDFFGTQKGASSGGLDSMHNEDLADVVGQEALALHKAESEADFKPADPESRGVGQVIDLTAHDETEQINLGGLRSAAS